MTRRSTGLDYCSWFFNGSEKDLEPDDVYSGAAEDDHRIEIEVNFAELTPRDREALGDTYAPQSVTSFPVWRSWQDGVAKTTGRAKAFPPFEYVRESTGRERTSRFNELAKASPELGLKVVRSQSDADEAMLAWERGNPDLLEDAIVAVTHLFGFNGGNKLSGLFDYVFVGADLRAKEESTDNRKTIIGRILERVIDRAAADAAYEVLAVEVAERQTAIGMEHLDDQLAKLAEELTAEVSAFASGRSVALRSATSRVVPQAATVVVSVHDSLVETSVDRQGHGFQRALLIAALKLLATHTAQDNGGSVVFLAIEEPELFQHPTQSRVFARVLRQLGQAPNRGIQVAYATHNAYFVDSQYFDQVRRVTRLPHTDSHPLVSVHSASLTTVADRLEEYVVRESILSRWDQVCTKSLSEALFAEGVILVEGDDDKGVLDGICARPGVDQFEALGVTVAVTRGKAGILLPWAILHELGIPACVIFDNDSGFRARAEARGTSSGDIDATVASNIAANRQILRFFGHPEEDYPTGAVGADVFVWDDRLESALGTDWPGFDETREELISTGRGARGKNAATYELAARLCPSDPGGQLTAAVASARALLNRGASGVPKTNRPDVAQPAGEGRGEAPGSAAPTTQQANGG